MANVVITCPKTGKIVPTGTTAQEESFKNNDWGTNTFRCSACGEMHTWSKKDAHLEEKK